MSDLAVIHQSNGMLDVERARELLRECRDVDMILAIRDAGKVAAEYQRLRGAGIGAINDAQELVLRAQRRFGEFLRESGPRQGGDRKSKSSGSTLKLADLGVSRDESSRCQRLAAAAEESFESHIAAVRAKGEKLTTSGTIAAVSATGGYDGDEWYTPEEYVDAARDVLGGIDLDPASNATAQQVVRASRFYTKEDSGLEKSWRGRVWMNPPYSRGLVPQFTTKFIEHFWAGDVPAGIILVNNATDTEWCRALLYRFVACFTKRIPFVQPDGRPVPGARQGQVFFYAGPEPELFAERFGGYGAVVRPFS